MRCSVIWRRGSYNVFENTISWALNYVQQLITPNVPFIQLLVVFSPRKKTKDENTAYLSSPWPKNYIPVKNNAKYVHFFLT